METSTVTTNGRLVIPKNIRVKYNIKPGTKVIFFTRNGELRMKPVRKNYKK